MADTQVAIVTGITVNCIAPSPSRPTVHSGKSRADLDRLTALAPPNRIGQPADVADAVSLIVSRDGAWTNRPGPTSERRRDMTAATASCPPRSGLHRPVHPAALMNRTTATEEILVLIPSTSSSRPSIERSPVSRSRGRRRDFRLERHPRSPWQAPGPDGIKPVIKSIGSSFSDFEIVVHDVIDGAGPDGNRQDRRARRDAGVHTPATRSDRGHGTAHSHRPPRVPRGRERQAGHNLAPRGLVWASSRQSAKRLESPRHQVKAIQIAAYRRYAPVKEIHEPPLGPGDVLIRVAGARSPRSTSRSAPGT